MNQKGLLRVVHIAEDMERVSGGIPAVVQQLAERLLQNCARVQVAFAKGSPGEMPPNVEAHAYPPGIFGGLWSWGPGLQNGVANLAKSCDGGYPVFHIHGAWSAPQYFAAHAAYKAGVPFVFSAHGMLEPWLWKHQGWQIQAKKRFYWSALAYPSLSKAGVVHAITPLERQQLSRLFPTKNIEVIPNAIDVNCIEDYQKSERDKTILFIGRIEPKKGVDILLHAFAMAKIGNDWSIDVVGPSWSEAYLLSLKKMVIKYGLGERVRFRGPVFGKEKIKLIDSAWVLAAPSHSEVIGLVNLEAAARCLPTITTYETGLFDWELGGGLLVHPSIDLFIKALETACSWSSQEQRDRGLASRHLVLQRYSWQAVMPIWMNLYNSLL